MMGHTHKKVNRDLFAMVGNLKKIKRNFLFLWEKISPNAHKNRYFIWILYFGIGKNFWQGI
jgi:hypothetical protein